MWRRGFGILVGQSVGGGGDVGGGDAQNRAGGAEDVLAGERIRERKDRRANKQ